ncbi:Qat anti-phage system TatD family nuclease QatD [Marinibaculum pumilum]|uniref:Qat anti-phage system TatD family nuclease QatD n=1 Tax=Marinibaculum pumilum TaxID=1766165 RepID=A0ABV7L3C5_9PROT
MIDFHCHLDLYPDPWKVARQCAERGVYVLSVTTTPSAWNGTSALAEGRIRTALGLHPQLAHERRAELPLFDELLPQARYVGEIGLDGAPEFRAHWQEQLAVFKHILGSCTRAGGRIMSLHSRRASKAVLDGLESHPGAGTPILHWFSGSFRDLERAVALRCWFSVGPAMLRGERGRELCKRMPRDRVLTETDGPFAQIKGQPLLPWEAQTAEDALADLWSIKPKEAQTLIHKNLQRLTREKNAGLISAP